MYTAYRHPEDLHAYIGMGQIANMKEGDQTDLKTSCYGFDTPTSGSTVQVLTRQMVTLTDRK